MPIITIAPPGNVPTGPGPVLNQQQLPSYDTRGEQQAIERLGKGMAMPMMDDSAALPYKALGAVGDAVVQMGGVLAAYAERKTDAESRVQVATLDNKLNTAWEREKVWQMNNPDTTQWESHWQQTYTPLRTEVLGTKNLHSKAREALDLRLIKYEGDTQAHIIQEGGKTAFAQAAGLIKRDIYDDVKNKNYGGALQRANDAVRDGYADPTLPQRTEEDIDRDKKATVVASQQADIDAINTTLLDDKGYGPFAVLDGLETDFPDDVTKSAAYPNLEPEERFRQVARAKQAVERLRDDNINGDGGIIDRIIDSDKAASEEEIETAGVGLRLPKNKIEDLKEFRRKHLENVTQRYPFNEKTAIDLFHRIERYSAPENKDMTGWNAILGQVMLMGEYGGKASQLTKGVLIQKLYEKHPLGSTKTVASELPSDLGRLLVAELDFAKANNSFGLEKVNVQATTVDANGQTVPVPGQFVSRDNDEAVKKYAVARYTLGRKLAAELQRNPDLANPLTLRDWVSKELTITKTGAAYDTDRKSLFPDLPGLNDFINPFPP